MNKLFFPAFLFLACYGIGNVCAQKPTDSIPLSGDTIIHRGIQLFDQGKYDEAIKLYKQVSLCDPKYSASCYEAALAYDDLGNKELALQKCIESLELDPENISGCIFKGSILDDMGRRDEAINWLESIAKHYPYNQSLIYNLAVCYSNKGDLEKAESLLIKGLRYNPYHTSSHLALGKINYMMGRKAHSYLAYNMGILMSPRIENVKRLEDAICGKSDSISKSYRYPYPADVEHSKWDKLTGLLNAEVAFRDDFPYDCKLNFLGCRQTFMLSQKMVFEPKDTSFYNQYYVRFFRSLVERKEFETFLYYSLKYSDNKSVTEWLTNNKDAVDQFISHARDAINLWKEYGFSTVNEELHQKVYHFSDDGDLESVGVLKENGEPTREGIWNFINEGGGLSQTGHYQNNNRSGEFSIYWTDGTIKQKLNYKNDKLDGLNYTYYPNGTQSGVYPRNNGTTDGIEEEYNSAGKLVSSTPYKANLVEGHVIFVDYGLGFKRDIAFTNNKREGQMTEDWLNSNKKELAIYADSLLNGTLRKWYANGQPEWEGVYSKGVQVGKWISYFADGTKSAEGMSDDAGNPTGVYTEFDHQGKLKQQISGYKNGKPDGIQTFYYPSGKESARIEVQNDVYKHVDCYNAAGEKIYSANETNGELNYKYFFEEGGLKSEGRFVYGQKDGIWKMYNVLGNLTGEETWKGGQQSGLQKYFHENGNPELIYVCDSGKIVGQITRFFSNGHVAMKGYYDKEGPTHEWIEYYKNDSTESRYYYERGKIVGRRLSYSPDGKLAYEETFNREGESIKIRYFSPEGKVIDELDYLYGSKAFVLHFPNGKIRAKLTISDRRRDGIQEYYFPNGQIRNQQTFISGNAQGKATEWDHHGKLAEIRNYCMNDLDGKYFLYENGTLLMADTYQMGTNHGLFQEFHLNGKVLRSIAEESGERQGSADCFAPDSTWMYNVKYCDDEFCALSYFDVQGKLHVDERINRSTKEVACYYKNGKISARIPFANGIFNGKHIIYYSNGQPLREINYINDYREGQSKYYYENGKLKELCNWLNGDRHGLYTLYFTNGQKQLEGHYLSNKKQGKWLAYNDQGKLMETLYYENDELYDIN